MKAYRLLGWEQTPLLADVEVPVPGPGQVLVKVAGNGLCHSDMGMAQIPGSVGRSLGWDMPFTLGHEVGGWIHDLGDGVGGWTTGDPVALISPHSCGECFYCQRGLDSACPHGTTGRGYGRDGGLAAFVLVEADRDVIKLKTLDPLVAGPLTDAGATAYHAVKRVLPKLVPGSTAVVLGAGGLGSFAVQFLRALSPAQVVAVDLNEARLEYVGGLGAHEMVVGVDASTVKRLFKLTEGMGAAAVLDFVGIDATIEAGLASVRPAGAFALIGAAGGTLRRPWYGALPKEAEVFNFQGSTRADAHEVFALAEAGLIKSEVDVFGLSQVAQAYEAMTEGRLRGRAVVTPQD
ncbi:MAG: alcohol dehydrogenase catalytic domain-containing protein [Acidimicrobiales bacterium]